MTSDEINAAPLPECACAPCDTCNGTGAYPVDACGCAEICWCPPECPDCLYGWVGEHVYEVMRLRKVNEQLTFEVNKLHLLLKRRVSEKVAKQIEAGQACPSRT